MEKAIAIFDIGKTNKKLLLFDLNMKLLYQEESIFEEITDDDGFACDDIDKIEGWIKTSIEKVINEGKYEIQALNFTTYGATLVYLGENGERLTPIYNYLKPMPEGIVEPLYEKYNGDNEFCRCSASPASGMLNSGFQALWLKRAKPEVFAKVKHILHFPQYLSYLFTGEICSEYTSIGCHTSLWNFDTNEYHQWTKDEALPLPQPVSNFTTKAVNIAGKEIQVGTGIHDSSSSLAPYIMDTDNEFLLLSTGTWCISMNPFNEDPLTKEQLASDCLSYMSINQKPVKSARFFMGQIHDDNTKRLTEYFGVVRKFYKTVGLNEELFSLCSSRSMFFTNGIPEQLVDNSVDLSQFDSFEEAYHQLMVDLTKKTIETIKHILAKRDNTKAIYITGGFARNTIFINYISSYFNSKEVFTSEIDNATALGAALMVRNAITNEKLFLELGLKKWTNTAAVL